VADLFEFGPVDEVVDGRQPRVPWAYQFPGVRSLLSPRDVPVSVKHLPKHLRPRWRYLAVELRGEPGTAVGRTDLQRELWFAAQNLVGDAGSAAVDLSVVDFAFDDGEGHAVVRTRRGETRRARAVVACLDAVDGVELGVRVRGTSGTVRACLDSHR